MSILTGPRLNFWGGIRTDVSVPNNSPTLDHEDPKKSFNLFDLTTSTVAAEAQSYRCIGADGKRYYGSTVPAQCRGLPVEELKIDRVLVAGVGSSAGSFTICAALVELAHELGRSPRPSEIAAHLGVHHETVGEAINRASVLTRGGRCRSTTLDPYRYAVKDADGRLDDVRDEVRDAEQQPDLDVRK